MNNFALSVISGGKKSKTANLATLKAKLKKRLLIPIKSKND
jgi:hypothetical protein